MTTVPGTVAILDSSRDTIELLEHLFQQHGFRTVSGHVEAVKRGELDLAAFMAEHDPIVVVWDVSPPYDENWTHFTGLRSSGALRGRGLVVTTTHKQRLDRLAGTDTGALEIVGKPYDLDLILKAVIAATPSAER